MSNVARSFERILAFGFLAVFATIFWPPGLYFFAETGREGGSNPYDFALFSALIPFLAVTFFASRRELPRMLRSAWPVLALCALAFVSAAWADEPGLTLRRSGTLTLTCVFGLYLVVRGDFTELVKALVKLYGLAALISLVLIALAPQLATRTAGEMYVHSWRGVFTDKNDLGLACGVAIMVSTYAFTARLGPRWLSAFTVVASFLLLFGSESKTPLIVLMAALYSGLIGTALRRRSGIGLAAGFMMIVVGLAGAAAMLFDWNSFLAIFGRDATFTNRTKIWHYALIYIAKRPWLGYGFGSFWRADGIQANQFWTLVEFRTPHAHNAWLEIGLNLGILGIALTALAWLATISRALRLLSQPGTRHAAFCLALLAGIFVENLTEYEFLRQGHIFWVLFAAVTTYLGNELAVAQRRQLFVQPSAAAPFGDFAPQGAAFKSSGTARA